MPEHFEGNMPARIPRMQTKLKTVPTKGFRQETLSCVVAGELANRAMKTNPKKENARGNAERIRCAFLKPSPLMLSGDLGLRGICMSFS